MWNVLHGTPVPAPKTINAPLKPLFRYGAVLLAGSLMFVGLPLPLEALASVTRPHPAISMQSGAGTLDTSFGAGGTVLTNLPLSTIGDSMAVQSDGKLVVAGFSISMTSELTMIPASVVARYNADGSLDSSFGSGGIVTLTQPPGLAIMAVAIQTDGKILLGGAQMTTVSATAARPELVRLNANGTLDTGFGGFGTVTNGSGVILSIALQPNGQIVTGGMINSGGALSFGVTRYNGDGSLDANFGQGGEVTAGFSIAFSVAVQADGKIVAGGVGGLSSHNLITGFPDVLNGGQFAVVRLNTDGSFDTSFGAGGEVQTAIMDRSSVSKVAIQSDGKILAGGTAGTASGPLDFALVRYNTDGSMDTTFGTSGATVTTLDGNSDAAFGVALQVDGRIVMAGSSLTGAQQSASSGLFLFPLSGLSGSSIALARFNTDGSLDQSFGSGGSVITSLQDGVAAFSVVIPQDDKVAVAGATSPGSGMFDFALARYDSGSLSGDFLLSPSATSPTAAEGSSATLSVSVQSVAGSTPPDSVDLSASVLPTTSGITATFSPTSISAGQSSTLTIATSSSTLTGVYSILISGTAGTITHSSTLTFTVTGQDFSISLSAPSITATLGKSIFPLVVINHLGGFTGKVTVTAPKTGLPSGVVFGQKKASKTRRRTLVIQYRYKVMMSATPGTYLLTFTGTDLSGRVRTATLTLIVPAPSSSGQ